MSDAIKHECGIAMVRLRKPLEYYEVKYGSWRYGLEKMYLLMEKQHNRGQDGAGLVSLKLHIPSGNKYIHRHRSIDKSPIDDIFRKVYKTFTKAEKKTPQLMKDITWIKEYLPFASELYLGHLRYGTFGKNNKSYVHPVMRENNWRSRNLVIAGNFNLTNVDEIFARLVDLGQHPKDFSDTVIMLENIGHFLDVENQKLFDFFKKEQYDNVAISALIADNLRPENILRESSKKWDGGYVIAGLIGHGDAFAMRDPWGIRPAYYYHDDEILVVASERPVIQTAMNVMSEEVHELAPGMAIIVKKNGNIYQEQVREPQTRKACSFERIYFSRGSDIDIYRERKKLGELLVPSILKKIDYDIKNTVFSFIPNTAEVAFYGLISGLNNYLLEKKTQNIEGKKLNKKELHDILSITPRIEKITIKDAKLRTFITQDKGRDDLVAHVYDITYGTIHRGTDTLVILDDSIVRGTTLKKSILSILDRLGPKHIIIASSSPQIRYPDCYGIDMAKLGDFIAFRAAIQLLKDTKQEAIINKVYNAAKASQKLPKEEVVNHVKDIYAPFSDEDISEKIIQMLTQNSHIRAKVSIIYQTIENLHAACPDNTGDWYFTGNYPTPGGNKVANNAFINFIEGKNQRAY